MAESFFATLECEFLDRHRVRTQPEGKFPIFKFIEGWYNPHRRHSACGNPSPIWYERNYDLFTPRSDLNPKPRTVH